MGSGYPLTYTAFDCDSLESLMFAFDAVDFNIDDCRGLSGGNGTFHVEVYEDVVLVVLNPGDARRYARDPEFGCGGGDVSGDTDWDGIEFESVDGGSVISVSGNTHVVVNIYNGGDDE